MKTKNSEIGSVNWLWEMVRRLEKDGQPDRTLQTKELHKIYDRMDMLLDLVDGCYEIIEIWPAVAPSHVKWKKEWLKNARACGASPDW